MSTTQLHVLNLGAGVQSTALYLMCMTGYLPIKLDYAIFADTGEEPLAVYQHVKWLQSLGGPPILIRTRGRLGEDLKRGTMTRNGTRFASIPAFTIMPGNESPGMTRRQCSREYKVEVIEKTIRRDLYGLAPGRRIPKDGAILFQYVGISIDESGRAERLKKRRTLGNMRFPLIERRLTRKACLRWLREQGNVPHPVPRSACVFCPYHDDAEWLAVKAIPEDWARAVEIDESLRTVGSVANRDMASDMYVHRSCQPLTQIEFKPKDPDAQRSFGFQDDDFGKDCLGVCGL